MNNQNTLSIDEAKFLKTSKKLHEHFVELSKEFKLSQTQELLAKSLGFRNLHDLQKIFTVSSDNIGQANSVIPSTAQPDIFNSVGLEQAVDIMVNLMDGSSTDMWKGRAISLIVSIMTALIHLRDNNEIILNPDIIREYLVLDNIIKLYKTRRDFPARVRETLRNYLFSLPGFQDSAPKQSEVVLEQHGYLQVQFVSVINKLKKVEENNFIITDKSWFEMEIRDEIISASGATNQKAKYNTRKYNELAINPLLLEFDFLEDSWLSMGEYEEWVIFLNKKQQLSEVRVSDLLVYVTTIISPTKRDKMYLVLNSILNNYYIASEVSKKICGKLKVTKV